MILYVNYKCWYGGSSAKCNVDLFNLLLVKISINSYFGGSDGNNKVFNVYMVLIMFKKKDCIKYNAVLLVMLNN